MRTRREAALAALGAMAWAAGCDGARPGPSVSAFAAASLAEALEAIGAAFAPRPDGVPCAFNFAGSAALARQIEQGARADVFAPADIEWMDYLAARGLIANPTRITFAANALALVAPRGAAPAITLAPGLNLKAALRGGRLAVGDVASVPAGRYARAALTHFGAWAGVADALAETDNVRAALRLVALGEAPLGVVYATDAAAAGAQVEVVAIFPPESHPPIIYPAAAIAGRDGPAALAFLRFLKGAEAQAILAGLGFAPAPAAGE